MTPAGKLLHSIDAKLAVILRALEVREDQADIDGLIRAAYRRGYSTGYNRGRTGLPADIDNALDRRRSSPGRKRPAKAAA